MPGILIKAPPRHGTSREAGVCSALGVRMFKDALHTSQPNEANQKGFNNDTEVEAFCHRLFSNSYFPNSPVELSDDNKEYLGRMIAERKSPHWGLKEWRISLFLPEFLKHAGE